MIELYSYAEPSHPVLREVAAEIAPGEITSPDTLALIDKMLQLAYPEQGDKTKPVLVGLAAPQVGISKRVILVDTQADGKGGSGNLQAFINPEIVEESGEKVEGYEGCRSTSRVCGIVERARQVKIRAYTREGQLIEQEVTGTPAVIFQHEIDHLNGIIFVERVKRDEDLHWVEKEEFSSYRKNWRNWPNKFSKGKWREIQGTVI